MSGFVLIRVVFQKKLYFFFDEIQLVSQWQMIVNSLRVDLPSDIFITGSNASILSGELATLLSGRYVQINVYPFSFAEFVELKCMHSFQVIGHGFR